MRGRWDRKQLEREGNLPDRGNIYGDPGLQAKRMPLWLEATEGQVSVVSQTVGGQNWRGEKGRQARPEGCEHSSEQPLQGLSNAKRSDLHSKRLLCVCWVELGGKKVSRERLRIK